MTCSTSAVAAAASVGRRPHASALADRRGAWGMGDCVDAVSQLDDQMALLADGDRSAIEPLFRTLWPLIHGYCERAVGKGADADDAAQQVMEKIFTEAVHYDRALRALPWAVAIAVWECRSVRRRRQRSHAVPLEVAADAPSVDPSPEDAAIEHDVIEGLRAIFEKLSLADREVLRLTFEPEAGEPFTASSAALRKRRERAVGRLREAWRKLDDH